MASLVVAVFVLLWVGVGGEHMLCPSSCSCLGHLVDCSKRGLIDIPTDLPVWVEILELQNNDITSISETVFKGLANLQQLDLSHNQLRSVNASAFIHLPSLRELKIQFNHLSEIPDLGHLPNLTVLSLHHNEIHSISTNALEGLPNLRTLDLNHNRIVDLFVDSFPNNTHLIHLYLNNNRIINLERGSLDNLYNLETLKLNKNHLASLPKELFRKLRSLKFLELNRNRLAVVEGLSFQGLESLQVLRLQNNVITSLLDGAFWGLSNIQQLKLDNNNISVVSKGWLYGLASLQQLSLRHNRITEVEEDGWEFCPQLWDLDLAHNRLQIIKKGTFSKLPKLQNLILNFNRISYIEDGAFKGLVSLETLELNRNAISWAVEDMNGVFFGLGKLTRLGLASNRITSIAHRAFAGLECLKHLDLSDNAVSNIQNSTFQGLWHLQHLKFNSSSLLCDCHLQWLPKWLAQAGFQTSVTARCAHPQWLKDKSIFDIKAEDFVCDDRPKPYITEEPQTQVSLKGSNVSLTCRAASSSNSAMNFQWKKDNINLKNAQVEVYANTSGTLTECKSQLNLWNISDKDEGRYQCVISNQFGSTYSQKAKITVHVFPTFLKTPSNVTIKAGSTARLECAAQGQPPPEVAWQKDGGDDFPAARERRMHVMPTDDVFFIVNVKSADMGIYSCTAKNEAGMVIANASLTVLETPSFVKPMEDKETRLGETTVLECMASGSPKPKLNWSKDGGPLIATERHFFTADNQLLIIVHTQYGDGGSYTCEMSNTLGTERDTSRLTVISALSGALDDESTTTGIIIIAVVCCVVGTSLVWVIIIYHTRKRTDELSPATTEESTLPNEIQPYPVIPVVCPKNISTQIYLENKQEHKNKESHIKECSKQSHDSLLTSQQQPLLSAEHKGPGVVASAISLNGPPSNSSLDTLTSTPSTRTTSSGDAFPARPTNHERLAPMSVTRAVVHSQPSVAEASRWNPTVRSQSVELPSNTRGYHPASQMEGTRDLGFATFPRNTSPSQHSWNTGSLRFLRLPKEVQNDSGSFSIESEDSRPSQPLLVATPPPRHTVSMYVEANHNVPPQTVLRQPTLQPSRLQALQHC